MATPKATPDYTELRNVAAPAGNNPKLEPFSDYIFVAGLPHPDNAGLQGLFGWRLGSLFVDDGGTVVKPNSTPTKSKGQWHRVFDGPLCVKWFGAKGNGSADDTKAIQATVLAATVSKKPSLYFPPGRYRLSQAIELTTDDFTLSGTAAQCLSWSRRLLYWGSGIGPRAILVNNGVPPLPPAEVKRITIRTIARPSTWTAPGLDSGRLIT